MIPTGKQPEKAIVDVKYKYDVDAQVLNDTIAYNNDNKVGGNNN